MANLSDAIARVCSDYLVRPEDEVGETVGREIQSAIDHYAGERFGFNEVRLYFTISTASQYALSGIIRANETVITRVEGRSDNPTTIVQYQQYFKRVIEIDKLTIGRYRGNQYTLDPITWDEMSRLRASNGIVVASSINTQGLSLVQSDPQFYTRYLDTIYFETSPPVGALGSDEPYDGFLDCHVEFMPIAEIRVGAQTNAFLDEGYDLICARAARMTAMKKLREYDHASQFAALESEALNTLRERAGRRMSTGRLVPHL